MSRTVRALTLAAVALSLTLVGASRPAAAAPTAPAHQLRHESYRLDNGMTIILREDHARPVVVVNLWYDVGAKDEALGRSGFAHLFEHLMFMGTERAPGSEFDLIMEGGGGFNNASTSFDRTNYYSTGPSSLLPTLLWLDADRLEDLGRMMTQEKLDKQREVVRNERRQTDENRPYGMADLAVDAEMFPLGHPYHHSIIGTHEDLQAASVQDVKDFFATFYVPSNASMVVAGDFDSATIKPLIARLFGTLPNRPSPLHGKPASVRLEAEKRLTLKDDVQVNRVTMAWHSPPFFANGDADLDVLAGVLATGKSSRLWNRLVRTGLCAEVAAWQGSRELQSLFEVEVLCPPTSNLDDVEKIIDEELAKLRAAGPTQAEVERVRNGIERAKLGQLDSLLGVADQMNAYQTTLGAPDKLQWDLGRYARATPQSVRSWAQRVIDPKRRLVVRVVGEDPRARPETTALATAFQFPRPQTWTLPNGLTIHLWERPELPLVSARLLLPAGATGDGPGRAGLTALALDMLDEGTTSLSASAFADALDALGASMSTDVGRETSQASLSGLARTFPRAFALWSDALTAPALSEEEWTRVKAHHLDELRQRDDDPASLAGIVATRSYFGDAHPFAWPIQGVVTSCQDLDLDAVARREREVMRPEGATLLVAGAMDRAAVEKLVKEHLGAWAGIGPAAAKVAMPARDAQPFKVILVPRPGAVQTVIRFAWPGVARSDADRLALELANTGLGGSFTSRLNQNLREKNGYTYGASSRVVAERSLGWIGAGASVRADVTGASLAEFLSEFGGIATGNLTEGELAKSVESTKNDRVSSTEGTDALLETAASVLARGESFDSFDAELARIDGVTLAELNDAARRHVVPRQGILVLVGDETLIREQIKGLELEPIHVLADPVGAGR